MLNKSQAVIAIGKRGGKIIGYKAGKPIYAQEDQLISSSAEVLPKGKGAFSVIPESEWKSAVPEWESQYKNKAGFSLNTAGIARISDYDSNTDAVLEQTGSLITDLLYDLPLVTPETSLIEKQKGKLSVLRLHPVFEGAVEGKTKTVATASLLNGSPSKIKAYEAVKGVLTKSLEATGGNGRALKKLAQRMDAMVRQRIMLRAMGALGEGGEESSNIFMITTQDKEDESKLHFRCDMYGRALTHDIPAVFDSTAYSKGETSNDPVLSAIFNVLQHNKKLAYHSLNTSIDIYNMHETSASGNMEKVKAIKGLMASLATPIGRQIGAKEFQKRTNALISEVASLNANALDFIKVCTTGVLGANAEDVMQMPVSKGDKPKPQPVKISEPALEKLGEVEASESSKKPTFKSPFSAFKKHVEGASTVENEEVLLGATQGGVIAEIDGLKVIVKKNKSKGGQDSEYFGSVAINKLLGDGACAPVTRLSKPPKGMSFEGDHLVAVQYIENQGVIPKQGGQLEAVLTADQKADLVALSMASWCISDSDAHGGNFLITEDGSLMRVDAGQAGVYMHMDGDPSNYHYSPNTHPIAFNALLMHYAGQHSDEPTDCTIDFNHPKILEALTKIESAKIPKLSGVVGMASGRAKQVRAHFEGMITEAMKVRSGNAGYSFKFQDGSTPPAWSEETHNGVKKKPHKAHHFKGSFDKYDVLKEMGTGVNNAKEVRSKANGAKYILKKFDEKKTISGMAEAVASNLAHRLLPPTISENGQSYFPTVPAYLVNKGNETSSVTLVQQKAFNRGNVGDSGALTNKQKGQVLASSVVRWLVGDNDGHGGQYMYSSPATGEADIISIDFGNAWKHDGKSEAKQSFKEGYFEFNPQSPPPKLDAKLYQAIMDGSAPLSLITENSKIAEIIENVEANKDEMMALAEPYFQHSEAIYGKAGADKQRAKFKGKLEGARAEWEKWVNHVMQKAGAKGTFSMSNGVELSKSLTFGNLSSETCLYKAIQVVAESALMNEDGEHTELALHQIRKFAKVCYTLFEDKVINRSDLPQSLVAQRLQFPDLFSEFEEIMHDPEIRRMSV